MTNAMRLMTGAPAPDDRDVALLSLMLRLRRFEEKAGMLYAMGTLATPCPLGVGKEAATAALAAAAASNVVLAIDPSPVVDVALGLSPSSAFERLVTARSGEDANLALLSEPGRPPVHLDEAAALARARAADTPLLLLASRSDDLARFAEVLPSPCLIVLMLPADRRPSAWETPPAIAVRECDGANLETVQQAIARAGSEAQERHSRICLSVLTPPYAGHARSAAGRTTSRRDTLDPIALYRQRLLQTGRLTEPAADAMEAVVRDEIAVAARALNTACPP